MPNCTSDPNLIYQCPDQRGAQHPACLRDRAKDPMEPTPIAQLQPIRRKRPGDPDSPAPLRVLPLS